MTNDELYHKLKNADKFSYRVKKILQQFEVGKLSLEDAHKAICELPHLQWTAIKPDYACVFITKLSSCNEKNYYNSYRLVWSLNLCDNDYYKKDTWYLALLDENDEEWDYYENCLWDEYLVLEVLPTLEEVEEEHRKEISHD